jgi:mannose-6-phosphate isomerase-like protein (cupin superfamily)
MKPGYWKFMDGYASLLRMANHQTRRRFLCSAPLAAAAVALPARSSTPSAPSADPAEFKRIPATEITEALRVLKTKPGNFSLFENPALPFTAVLTIEEKKAAKEFEWHEGRDHLFQVIDGSTVYEIGGTPQNGRNTKPGEWLAPESKGATKLTLNKGDWLIIPRNTPHKRITEGSVTFYLISPTGSAKA